MSRKLLFSFITSLSVTFAVNAQAPVANFTMTVSAGCPPLVVNFTDASSNSPTSWSWNFGSMVPNDVIPATAIGPKPLAVFNTPGTYTVTLIATNGSGSSAPVQKTVTVYPTPTADFNTSNPADTMGCSPLHVQFVDASKPGGGSSIIDYSWFFGDGTTASGPSPSHIFTLPGNYTVNLQVTNNYGCQGNASLKTKSKYIVVTPGVSPNFYDSLSASCRPPTNAFFMNSSTGPGVMSYTWRFGDGGTSNQTAPSHIYLNSGTYPVTLIAQSSQGCVDSTVENVTVSAGSVQSIITSVDSVCVGSSISFQNSSTPPPNSSSWQFGDGGTSNQPFATHVYAAAGTYTVTLNNNFATCSDSTSKLIHVLNPPVANFTALTATNSCKTPLTVNFQDQSTGATQWVWDFGDGSPFFNGQNPSHTYTTYGQFNVTLIASNAGGCSNTVTKAQFVQVLKPAVHITNLPAYGCAPFTFSPTLVDTVVDGIASYSWDFGNGNTYTVANPPAQVYGAGQYAVKLTITSTGGCTASFVDTVKVGTIQPTVNFSANPTSVCANSPVNFTDLSTNANQWLWDFGDGSSSTQENPQYSYSVPGKYDVTLTAYNNGCFAKKTMPALITVNPPFSKFNYSVTCGNKTQYTFNDQSTGAMAWNWDFGDGTSFAGKFPPPHTYPLIAKAYTVTLKVTNGGCTNTSTQTINVLNSIVPISTSYSVCKNSTITVTITNIDPATKFYIYDFGDGTRVGPALSASQPHQYTSTGNFTVKVITTDTLGCQDSVLMNPTIQVNGPTAVFTAPTTQACGSLNAQFADQSISALSPIVARSWDFGDGGTSTQTNPNHLYTVQGSYPVKLKVTDQAGCSDSVVKPSFIILSTPAAGFTTADSFYCPSSLIKFTNTSLGGFNPVYTWDFGDGTNFTGPNPPPHNYPLNGKYTVALNVKDSYNCTASFVKTNYITIDTPSAAFTIDDSVASCPPLLVHFTFAGSYYKSVLWNFGLNEGVSNALPTTQNLYGLPNTYTATLTVTSPGGCIAQTSKLIKVNGPIASFNYSPLGGCDSLTVNFNVATSGVVGYTWFFGNNDSVTNSVPFVTYHYSNSGSYTPAVRVLDTSGCGVVYPGNWPIVIDSVKAKFITDKSVLCQNGSIQFTDTSYLQKGTVATNYFWDFGDGQTNNGMNRNPSHFYASPGTYNAKLMVSTQDGCIDSVINTIKVVANPVIGINGVVWQCVPATLNFDGQILVPDTSAYTWLWDFDNGQSSTLQTPPAQLYSKAGHYIVKLTATNSSNCSTIDSSDLFIYPLPNIYAGADTTICLGQNLPLQATGGVSYTWLPPSNNSLSCNTCFNPIATPTTTTSYYVSGVSANGCQATDTIVVTVNQPVTVTVNPTLDSVCLGQSVQLFASGAALYAWTPAAGLNDPTLASPTATPSTTTNYQVIGSDNKYCFSDTGYVQVTVFNYPTINAGPDATILVGSSYQIPGTGSPDIVSINWQPVKGLSCTNCLSPLATPINTTTYVVTAVNNGTCATSDSLKLTVVCNNNNFFVPNTFSPNGDGNNDVFYVRGKGLNIIPSITIFNRWGQIVFEKKDFAPNDPSAGWDGMFNGKPAPVDVYVYTIQIICDNSTLIPYHGNVTLIR